MCKKYIVRSFEGGGQPELSNSGGGVENDLGSIHAVHEPVQRMVASVTDVHSYLTELRLEHPVASVALHVVGGLGGRKNRHNLFYCWFMIGLLLIDQVMKSTIINNQDLVLTYLRS